jgi:5-methylcytosine-specific restriction endonuclease McrA
MSEIAKLLHLVPKGEITEEDVRQVNVSIDATIDDLTKLGGDTEGLRLAVFHVLMRALETALLADNELLHVARFREMLLGRADAHIRKRVQALVGTDPPTTLVSYLRKCLTGDAAQKGEKCPLSLDLAATLFRKVSEVHPRRELRCEVCGYHFRPVDLGPDRLAEARAAELRLAEQLDPGRIGDEFKPQDDTGLEIDHVVPEAGLGWTMPDNLRITCCFCNQGRQFYRRSLEAMSLFVAGSHCCFPEGRSPSSLRRAIAVASFQASGGACQQCHATIANQELTIRQQDAGHQMRHWFVPWNTKVLCYRCA